MACVSGRGGGKAGVTVIHPGPQWGVQGQPPPQSLQDGSLIHRMGAWCLRESEEEKVPALPAQGPGVGDPQSEDSLGRMKSPPPSSVL